METQFRGRPLSELSDEDYEEARLYAAMQFIYLAPRLHPTQTLTADEAEICEDIWATYSHGLPTGSAHAKGFQQGASEKQRMWIGNAARRILARAALKEDK